MKLKKIFLIFAFSFFSFANFFAQQIPDNLSGVSLSNQIYNYLRQDNFKPEKEYLVSNVKNNFPYNIIINFNKDSNIRKNLIFVISQEEVLQNKVLIKNLCQECKKSDFPITILFSYGQNQLLTQQTSISGTKIFIENALDTSVSSTVIILKLSEKENKITSASNGKTSPSWLLKNLFRIILKSDLDFNLPPYYLSQLYTFNFFKDADLDNFFNVDIPCVKLSLEKNQNIEALTVFLSEIINMFDENSPMNFDQHFFILNIFRKSLRMNEQFMVICVISIIFIFLVFIFMAFFIDSQKRNSAFMRLKNNWHPLIFTFVIILASFLLGKGCFLAIQKDITSTAKIFVLYMFQIIISLIFCFVFYAFEYFHNLKIDEKAIEYTVIISSFLNQFIFLYIDISLFPLFSIVCILAVISRYIKRPVLHIPVLFFMALPFLIYSYILLKNSQLNELKSFLLSTEKTSLVFSFILCPYFLKMDRIFISYAKKTDNRKIIIKYTSIFVSAFCGIIVILSGFYAHLSRRNSSAKIQNIIKSERDSSIICSYFDSTIFDDTLRSLSIVIPENAISCDVRLVCENNSPVLYSDNSYNVIDKNTCAFLIPSNPPERMWFSFGTTDAPMTITVTVIYPDSAENQFIMQQKTVKISS